MQDHTVAGLHAQKTEALALLAKYLKYQGYLESVLEVTDMFHQIDDLLARHSTLEQANTDLRQQQWHAADVTEKTACVPALTVPSAPLPPLRRDQGVLHAGSRCKPLSRRPPTRCCTRTAPFQS